MSVVWYDGGNSAGSNGMMVVIVPVVWYDGGNSAGSNGMMVVIVPVEMV